MSSIIFAIIFTAAQLQSYKIRSNTNTEKFLREYDQIAQQNNKLFHNGW